jgi:hypothetical protein
MVRIGHGVRFCIQDSTAYGLRMRAATAILDIRDTVYAVSMLTPLLSLEEFRVFNQFTELFSIEQNSAVFGKKLAVQSV